MASNSNNVTKNLTLYKKYWFNPKLDIRQMRKGTIMEDVHVSFEKDCCGNTDIKVTNSKGEIVSAISISHSCGSVLVMQAKRTTVYIDENQNQKVSRWQGSSEYQYITVT